MEARRLVRDILLKSDLISENDLSNFPFGVAYTAVVFEDKPSIANLEALLDDLIEKEGLANALKDWKKLEDYHMTVTLGKLPLHLLMRGDVGSEVEVNFTDFGYSDEAVVFKVNGYMSKNDVQHVTMLFKNSPSKSKKIVDWTVLDEPFSLTGIIKEFPNKY